MNKELTATDCLVLANTVGLADALCQLGLPLKINIFLHSDFWEAGIDELTLSVRSKNGLMRAGLNTIGKTAEQIMSQEGLDAIRNLGKKSITEIKTAILVVAYSQLSDNECLAFWEYILQHNA